MERERETLIAGLDHVIELASLAQQGSPEQIAVLALRLFLLGRAFWSAAAILRNDLSDQ